MLRRPSAVLALAIAAASVARGQEAPSPADAEAQKRPVSRLGAAIFPELRTMTVVYPAGPGEPVDLNRRSATARAAWLRSVYHADAAIAADDALSDAQKKGNLLILGWANRAWSTLGVSAPFKRGADDFAFAGLTGFDADLDLLVMSRNPLEPASRVLFWSRIDPPRDRSLVLPRVGSDWAVFKDYKPVQQGMLQDGSGWPLVREPTAESRRDETGVAKPGTFATASSEHFRAFYDQTATNATEIEAILKARETGFKKAVDALGPVPAGYKISLNIFPDDATKKARTGVPEPTHSLPWVRETDMTKRYARSTSPHEEVHVVAGDLYGPCVSSALYEGLAIAVENSWHGDELDVVAARLKVAGRLPTIATLLDEEAMRALPEEQAFAGAGVFVRWLRTTHADAVKAAYVLPEPSGEALARVLRLPLPAVEAAFAAWAEEKAVARRSDLDFAAAEAEAQQAQTGGDWPGMVAALEKALKARPKDPQTLFNLASAQMRAEDLKGAERTLDALLALPLAPADSRFAVFGHYQLGRVLDLAGHRERALAEYRRVLELPDEHGAHALAQERIASPATREQLE